MSKNEENRYGHLLDKFTDNYAKEEMKRRYGHLADKFDELEKKRELEEAKIIVSIGDTIEKGREKREKLDEIIQKYFQKYLD